MPSLYDKKLNDWNPLSDNVIDLVDEPDVIDKLLVNTDFDAVNIPDLDTRANMFIQMASVDDVQSFDQAKDTNTVLESVVEEFPSLVVEPIGLVDARDEELPVIETNNEVSFPVECYEATSVIDNPQKPNDSIRANSEPEPVFFQPDMVQLNKTDTLNHTTQSSDPVNKQVINEPKPTASAIENTLISTDTLETLSSLVQNHAKVEKFVITGDFVVNKIIQRDVSMPQGQTEKSSEPMVVAPLHTAEQLKTPRAQEIPMLPLKEWQTFKDEQVKLQNQHQQRMAKLEKKLARSVALNLVTLIFAGLALMAAASCYLKVD